MKKIFLFTAVLALTLSSCSDDDNKGADTKAPVMVTINGVKKAFTKINAVKDGERIYITAINDNNSEVITFEADKGYTGDDSIYYPEYMKDSNFYVENDDARITDNVEVNNDFRLKGTFQGKLVQYDNDANIVETITLTNGSFDIAYEK